MCFYDGRTRTDEATSPNIAMYVLSIYCATETSPKKEAQIAQINTTAITVPSVKGGSYVFFLQFSLRCTSSIAVGREDVHCNTRRRRRIRLGSNPTSVIKTHELYLRRGWKDESRYHYRESALFIENGRKKCI